MGSAPKPSAPNGTVMGRETPLTEPLQSKRFIGRKIEGTARRSGRAQARDRSADVVTPAIIRLGSAPLTGGMLAGEGLRAVSALSAERGAARDPDMSGSPRSSHRVAPNFEPSARGDEAGA